MIRPATKSDIPALVAMGAEVHALSHYRAATYSPAKVADFLEQLIDDAYGFAFVMERGGLVVAYMIAHLGQPYYSDDLVATEISLYALPAHRSGFAALRLLSAFVAWAQQLDAKIITAGIMTGITLEKTAQLYHRIGFDLMGVVFQWSDN
jgi:L-amino acid N-acyltransferase YncA